MAALAISLVLNVCVIAGGLWSRYSAPAPTTASERFRQLEATLDLNDQQRAAFEAYSAASRERTKQLRQEIEPMIEAAWAQIGKPKPDEALILERIGDASSRWRAFQRETVEATLALLATLNPEQRAKFVAAESERRAAQRRRHAEEQR
ncbi:MAG TPA: periplasmic heavy metal sensor [Stellaceae bacterium]|nr:periplasmic heavy metal sensor [Stellaceae bacterium]